MAYYLTHFPCVAVNEEVLPLYQDGRLTAPSVAVNEEVDHFTKMADYLTPLPLCCSQWRMRRLSLYQDGRLPDPFPSVVVNGE